MPANARRDLIWCLKVKHLAVDALSSMSDHALLIHTVRVPMILFYVITPQSTLS